ncbi:NHL repeat-containing protein [Leptospira meyeri]|uniref:NHL repeat-containing protein n=1 Tax=Leptospira meyeri TaxID=29508 RepID=A0A4R8MVU0_LEPME|nr:NHL repeat-containing protein [Leptospira meyeri]EKJ87742.1 NHL repeat protein [Leptospira meyeri serovar Hardjo str. Went 5]TDY73543.1 NHL repeat-containing protein [Leptospira meyeri]TGL53378.1 hypothetical protein EHQ55_01980 [Leptospira meyeri]
MASLSNPCDSESKDFFPQLLISASIEGGFCQLQVVNTGDLYRFTDFTFYKSIPISVLPRLGSKTNVSVRPNLPEGLYVDPNTGALSGNPTTPVERQTYTVYRKGVVQSQVTIEVRDLVATKVYGQLGNLNCADPYVNGSCGSGGPATAYNLSGPNAVITDNSGGVYIASGNRVLYYPPDQTTATRVYGQHGQFTCDVANANPNLSCMAFIIAATTLVDPRALFLDASNNLFVTDTGTNHRILAYQNGNTIPFRAIGVPNFITSGGAAVSATSLNIPTHMSQDSSGGFYVSDTGYNRVLYFPKDASIPSEVYGQTNFASSVNTPISASSLSNNQGVVVDSAGGIYIADTINNRVVYYPKGSTTAIRVYGQSNFTTGVSSTSSNGLNQPFGIALDQSENLFVADLNNNRVLVYPQTSLATGMTAIAVVGQFGSFGCGNENNNGSCGLGSVNAQNLNSPVAVHFDKQGRMYIADSGNNRVLVY